VSIPPRPLPSSVAVEAAELPGSDRRPTDGTDRTLTVDGTRAAHLVDQLASHRVTGDGSA
jgi:hypothetical protein